jgi:hypothetical protein
LGFANFYRRFIKGYSGIAAPLSELTKTKVDVIEYASGVVLGKDKLGRLFQWTKEAQGALDALKKAFTTALILCTFDPRKHIVVETDASDFAIGVCIS